MYNTDMPTRAELPSSRKLFRSTAIAVVTAAALLVTVVLPAEYVLGLTEMGEIKQQLAVEAEADAQTADGSTKPAEAKPQILQEIAPSEFADAPVSAVPALPEWKDTVTLTLAPGAAAEVKLTMQKDGVAAYEWVTNQGHLNSDLHADGANKAFASYRKGRAETSDAGDLKADFDGAHGWFWRNRSNVDVRVTLRVSGAYSEVKRVL